MLLRRPCRHQLGSLAADEETPNGERLRHFLVGANLCAVNTVIWEGDGAAWVPTRERPRRIDFVAVSLPEMLRVKRCWVASELDVATVRDDHYAVVVDLETMCPLLMRNLVCREAFQQDLERIQVGTAGIHVDEHHAVCMRAIQDLAQKHFGRQKQEPRKHWLWNFMDCVKVLRRVKRMVCENSSVSSNVRRLRGGKTGKNETSTTKK